MRRVKSLSILLALSALAARALAAQYVPSNDLPRRPQIVLVYIGAQDCVACHDHDLVTAFPAMNASAKAAADRSGRDFAAIGVSLDWSVDTGVTYLQSVGRFDEIVAGSNWINSAADRYIWADSTSTPAMPQVVLVERTVSASVRITSAERVIGRFVGAPAITQWVRQGTPLPTTTP